MSKGKIKSVLFIIIFLLIAAVIASWLTSGDPNDRLEPAATEAPAVMTAPPQAETPATYAPAVSTPAPVSTSAPTATPAPTPTPTPTPTPAPTPTPEPAGQSLGHGTFTSDTGVPMNIRADWEVTTLSSTQVQVKVSVSLDSYAIHIVAVPGSVHLNVNGQYVSIDGPAVDYDGAAQINTSFGSKTFTLDVAQGSSVSVPLEVEWSFGGSYHGTPLDAVKCGGYITIAR